MKLMLGSLNIQFDILALTETWIPPNYDVNIFHLVVYTINSVNRQNKRGGGVMLYTKNDLKVDVVQNLWFCDEK